jgi:prepilin-type N-terminal cleavage/methylation domain-containing protein
MNSRHGFSLVELLVVITAMTAILAASVVLIHFVLQFDHEVRQRTHIVTTIGRLAEQFRRDVHQARGEPFVASDHRSAELHLAGGTVVKWRSDPLGDLVRLEQAKGVADRENTFTLPKGTAATMEIQPQGTARIVAIRVHSSGTNGPTLSIEALAGRDERAAVEEAQP